MKAIVTVTNVSFGETSHFISAKASVQGFGTFGMDFDVPFTTSIAAFNAAAKNQAVAKINDTTGQALTNADVLILDEFQPAVLAMTWTKDITKTNIGTALVNVYVGTAGEAKGANFSGFTQYRFVVYGNKVGTGNLTHALVDTANAANTLGQTFTGAAGEFLQDTDWTNLPTWATGEKNLKPMASSTVGTDDPIYRGFDLYLR